MRYVQTAAVTSHAALTCSPRESAIHANAPPPTSATTNQPSHESTLPMRVPSLGVTLPPNWASDRSEATAGRTLLGRGYVWLPLPYHISPRDSLPQDTHRTRVGRGLR